MKQSGNWARVCALFVVAALMLATAPRGGATQQSPTTYNINLALAEQSQDNQGRNVVTMIASGDLPGVLTLTLATAPDGTVTGGEWALVVSYTAPVNPNAPPVPNSPDPDSGQGEQLIQRGVLNGTLTGGATAAGTNAAFGSLTGIQLNLTGGTIDFANVPNGSGKVDGSSVDNRSTSTGSMTLTF